MFLKRVGHSSRSWLLAISQLLVPLVFTILALVVIKTIPGPQDSPPLQLGLARLPRSVVVYSSGDDDKSRMVAGSYAESIHSRFPSAQLRYVNDVVSQIQ